MIIIDFLFEQKSAILVSVIVGTFLILAKYIIIKHHKEIMDFVGEIVKFSYRWIIPSMFMIAIYLDPKYSLQQKYILALYFCGLGIAIGYLYRLAENIDDNQ